MKRYKSFGIIEIIVAMAIMLILAVTGTTMITQTFSTNRLSEETTKAHLYAQEGIEAMKSIKKQSWNTLTVSGSACDSSKSGGVLIANNLWQWTSTSNIDGKYTREIKVENICKDINGDIVETGGTVDPNIKKITSTVSWDFTSARQNKSELITYLANWDETLIAPQCDWSNISVIQTINNTGSADIRDITYVDPFIYSTNRSHYSNEFYSYDISDLQNIISSGINIGSNSYGLDTYGDTAYLATSSNTEIRLVDISDPYNPTLTANSIDLSRGDDTYKIQADASNLYIARRTSRNTGEFLIYDRQTLTLKDDYEVNAHVYNLFIDGSYAYLATTSNSKELIELDISDPNDIQLVGSYNTQDGANANAVFSDGTYIYLTTSNNTGSHSGLADAEVYVIQTNHTSPNPFTLISQYDVGDDVFDVQVYEDKIFLGTDLNGKEVIILDTTNITNLLELSSVDADSRVYAIYTDMDNCMIYAGSRSNTREISIIGGQLPIPGNDNTMTYYFDSYDSNHNWDQNVNNVVDGNTSTQGRDNDVGESLILTTNTGDGSDLGTISKVEIRSKWAWNNPTGTWIGLQPQYPFLYGLGNLNGNMYEDTTQSGNNEGVGAYSNWYDITNDTNSPPTWTWNDVQNLDMGINIIRPTWGRIQVFIVELRVTYTPDTPPTSNQADNFVADTSQAVIKGPGDKNLEDILISNSGIDPITVTHMRVTWTGGQKNPDELKDIKIDGNEVFDHDSDSGELLDIDDIIIDPTTTLQIDSIRFNSDLSGAILTIEFHMSDLSIYTISNIQPADG